MEQKQEIIGSQEVIGISGSHGHIGGRLFERYISQGITPVRLDRTGFVPPEVTKVFDFAAYGNKYNQTDEKLITSANILRVQKLLENSRGKTVVLTSSSSVLLPTQTAYSKSKSAMEELAQKWVDKTGENVIVVRPSTVVGVGDDFNHLIPQLIVSCMTGRKIDFVGEPTHDFIDVDDFLDGVLYLTSYSDLYKGQIFNVSFGVSMPNEFVKDVVALITGKQPVINRVAQLRSYDTKDWKVPNDKLRALGWRPKKDIFKIIQEMIKDYVESKKQS